MTDFDDRSGRDNRLLALVILIAIVVLVVLARVRFPGSESRPVAVAPGPLERLAARTTYDDLAAAVHTALQRVEPSLITVAIEPSSGKAIGGDASVPADLDQGRIGVRLGDDWAIVYVPRGFRVVRTGADDPLVVRDNDLVRDVAVISLPLRAGEDQLPVGSTDVTGFAYVCVVEPTPDGPTATPVFIGRIRTLIDQRWGDGVIVPGNASGLTPGALIFQLDGRFLGLVVAQPGGGNSIVPAGMLINVVSAVRTREPGGAR